MSHSERIPDGASVSKSIRQFWTEARERIDREARESRNSQAALLELSGLYDRLPGDDRPNVDQLLAEWVLSEDENLRFDALALIRQKAIVTARPALERLLDTLESSDSPSAPFEASKVRRVIAEI